MLENKYETLEKRRCGNVSTCNFDVTMQDSVVPYSGIMRGTHFQKYCHNIDIYFVPM